MLGHETVKQMAEMLTEVTGSLSSRPYPAMIPIPLLQRCCKDKHSKDCEAFGLQVTTDRD